MKNMPLFYIKLSSLPSKLQEEVINFIDFIIEKNKKSKKNKTPKFGSHKKYFITSPDFDEPLKDFEEYMK